MKDNKKVVEAKEEHLKIINYFWDIQHENSTDSDSSTMNKPLIL